MKNDYVYVCKGCLIGAGADPDKITGSCINKSNQTIECAICGMIQDGSWFKHMTISDLPESLRNRL